MTTTRFIFTLRSGFSLYWFRVYSTWWYGEKHKNALNEVERIYMDHLDQWFIYLVLKIPLYVELYFIKRLFYYITTFGVNIS